VFPHEEQQQRKLGNGGMGDGGMGGKRIASHLSETKPLVRERHCRWRKDQVRLAMGLSDSREKVGFVGTQEEVCRTCHGGEKRGRHGQIG